ncbi:MAG: signal peptidase II [Candidatus Marinimicrobia bacterium]|nr:signal peptidase II [Candidatus Neomarinimicrobiota bacterium]
MADLHACGKHGSGFQYLRPPSEIHLHFRPAFHSFLFYRIIRENPGKWINFIAFTLILAGAVGNFIDRFTRGR